MRDVSSKYASLRTARATALLRLGASTVQAVSSGNTPKADPLTVARVAAIQAAKNTSTIIPYCHQVPLDHVQVDIDLHDASIAISAKVKAIAKTGVEMEALVAASTAALTLYDMLKPIDSSMEIVSIRLDEKKGGKSGVKETGAGLAAAVLVLSDSISQGTSEDRSGKLLMQRLRDLQFADPVYKVLPDDQGALERELVDLADRQRLDLVITTGGTGIGPRDVTPEGTLRIIDRRLEGVEEALRSYSQDRVATAMLSRAIAGVRGHTLIVNLPGSAGAAEDGVNALFPSIIHAFKMMRGEKH
jgi:molybdenum cofactor biosynthesis protein MoaC